MLVKSLTKAYIYVLVGTVGSSHSQSRSAVYVWLALACFLVNFSLAVCTVSRTITWHFGDLLSMMYVLMTCAQTLPNSTPTKVSMQLCGIFSAKPQSK